MTVTVLEGGHVVGHTGYAGTAGRKEAHYRGLYDALLADPSDPRLGVALATDIARIFESATAAGWEGAGRQETPAGVRWSSID
jgi:hypothetical protein